MYIELHRNLVYLVLMISKQFWILNKPSKNNVHIFFVELMRKTVETLTRITDYIIVLLLWFLTDDAT